MTPTEKYLRERHGDIDNLIPELVNQHGQKVTAGKLGVEQSWISNWLKTHGYKRITLYVKEKKK